MQRLVKNGIYNGVLKKFENFLLFLTFLIPDIFNSITVGWNILCSSFHKNTINGRNWYKNMLRPHVPHMSKKAYQEENSSKFNWVPVCFSAFAWRKAIIDIFKSKLYLNQILACNNCIIKQMTIENHSHFFLRFSFSFLFFYKTTK